jgi:hypothetical protein
VARRDVLFLGTAVERGITQWDTMAGRLDKEWPRVSAELKALNDAAPWGDGSEGRAFAAAYLQGDGPNRLVETGTELIGQIVDAGPRLRATIANSRGTDAAIEADLSRRPTVREV